MRQRVVRGLLAGLSIDPECRVRTQRISVYSEHLDLSRFTNPQHDGVLRNYLRDKFRDRPIGVLVAQGSSSLEFVMRSRAELWPGVPVVFAAVDAATAARLNLPPDVTGKVRQLTFRNAVITAQALVPNLKRIAVVGEPWERQAVRRHYKDELPAFAAQFEIIDLIGLPMTEIRKRVAVAAGHIRRSYTRPSTSMAPGWPTFRMKVSPRLPKWPTGRS